MFIINKSEIKSVLKVPDKNRQEAEGSHVAIGQAKTGRCLRVIYVPDPLPDSVFVITAYDLSGKALKAYKRRRRRKLK